MEGIEMREVEEAGRLIEERNAELLQQVPAAFAAELHEEDDNMKIESLSFHANTTLGECKATAYILGSAGIAWLLFRWFPVRHLRITHRPCNADHADAVLVSGSDGSQTVVPFFKASDTPAHFSFRLVTFWQRVASPLDHAAHALCSVRH
eukprot:2794978-Rhodomonas_salina.2